MAQGGRAVTNLLGDQHHCAHAQLQDCITSHLTGLISKNASGQISQQSDLSFERPSLTSAGSCAVSHACISCFASVH